MLTRMMTTRLENDLEGLVQDCLAGKTKYQPDFINGADKSSSWQKQFEQLVLEFQSLSDYDARDIIPHFSEAFLQAQKKIAESDLTDEEMYEALYRLSTMRRKMDIDRRAREINKGMTTWTA